MIKLAYKLIMIFVCTSLFGQDNKHIDQTLLSKYQKEFMSLSDNQKKNLWSSFQLGKENGLGLTISAIDWQESKAGKFQINLNRNGSWDCGRFGNNTTTVLNHSGDKLTLWNKRMVCTRLIEEPLYAYTKALKELTLWKTYWGTTKNKLWYKIWGSYNGGTKPNLDYAKKIHHRTIIVSRNLNHLALYK